MVIVLTSLSGCGEAKIVKVGFLGDLSGRGSEVSVTSRDALQLLIEEYNAEQDDYEIQLVVKDNASSSELAASALLEFKDEDITIVFGPMMSNIAYDNRMYLESGETLFISPTVSTMALKGIDDFMIRMIPTNDTQGINLAEKAITLDTNKELAIVYESNNIEYTRNVVQGFKEVYEAAGGTVVYENMFATGDSVPYEGLAYQIDNSGAEDILIVSSAIDVATLCQYLETMESEANIYTSLWANQDALVETGGSAVEDVYILGAFDEDNASEDYKAFEQRYEERYGASLAHTAIYTYDAMTVLKTVLNRDHLKSVEAMKAAIIEQEMFNGYAEPFSINGTGDVERDYVLYQIKDGDIVKVD